MIHPALTAVGRFVLFLAVLFSSAFAEGAITGRYCDYPLKTNVEVLDDVVHILKQRFPVKKFEKMDSETGLVTTAYVVQVRADDVQSIALKGSDDPRGNQFMIDAYENVPELDEHIKVSRDYYSMLGDFYSEEKSIKRKVYAASLALSFLAIQAGYSTYKLYHLEDVVTTSGVVISLGCAFTAACILTFWDDFLNFSEDKEYSIRSYKRSQYFDRSDVEKFQLPPSQNIRKMTSTHYTSIIYINNSSHNQEVKQAYSGLMEELKSLGFTEVPF